LQVHEKKKKLFLVVLIKENFAIFLRQKSGKCLLDSAFEN